MDTGMDTEKKATQQLDSSKKTILEAVNLIEQMAKLKERLHIREGAGQRYLQKTKPDQGLLQQAEKEIVSQYAGGSDSPTKKTGKTNNLLKTMNRNGRI